MRHGLVDCSVGGWLVSALVVIALVPGARLCQAQSTTVAPAAASAEDGRSIEDLNLVGAAVAMPAFADTVLGVDSGLRRALFGKGMALRVNVIPRFTMNLLAAPRPPGQQVNYQLRMPAPVSPARGFFLGGPAMAVPSELNPYDRYYEARLYQRGMLASRPTDILSLIASYRGHSCFFTDALVAQGKTVWRSSTSVTGTYTADVSAGDCLSLSLGYVRGAAISPRVDDSPPFTVSWSLFL